MAQTVYQLPTGSTLALAQSYVDAIQATGAAGALILVGEFSWAGTLTVSSTPGVSIQGVNAKITQTSSSTATIAVANSTNVIISDILFVDGATNDTAVTFDTSDDCCLLQCRMSAYAGTGYTLTGTCARFHAISGGSAALPADGFLYLGDPSTNGSWRVSRHATYSSILIYENRVAGTWTVIKAEVMPSGDATGATDYAAIQHCLTSYSYTQLLEGTYSTNATLSITTSARMLAGVGKASTILDRVDAVAAVLYCNEPITGQIMLKDLTFSGGLHGVHLDNTPHVEARGVRCSYNGGHGWFCDNGCWSIRLSQCELVGATLDGFRAFSAGDGNGNDCVLTDCSIRINTGAGVYWGANGLKISGCQIENNTDCGIHLRADTVTAYGASIVDNRFEENGAAANGAVFLDAAATAVAFKRVDHTLIQGNYINQSGSGTLITASGDAGDVRWLRVDNTNVMSGPGGATYLDFGAVVQSSEIYVRDWSLTNITNTELNDIAVNHQRKTITEYITVDCSAGGTAQTATLVTLPTGTIIHDVMCFCSETFNGSGTKSFEVGIASDPDKYIDVLDFTPLNLNTYKCTNDGTNNGNYVAGKTAQYCTSAQVLQAYWTNDGGTPTTGKVTVGITYTLAPIGMRAST